MALYVPGPDKFGGMVPPRHPLTSWQPPAPVIRVLGGVEDAIDHDDSVGELVEDGIGELPHQGAAIVLGDDGVHLGESEDCLDADIGTEEKILAALDPPGLVSEIGFVEIRQRLGCDDQFRSHDGCEPFA